MKRSPLEDAELLDLARAASKRLRYYAEMTIESNEARGAPPEDQDRWWRQGQADLALARRLSVLARHGRRI